MAYSNPKPVDLPTACQLPQLRPGPKPFFEQFPELITVVTDFVKLHGFSAEARRRSSVGNMVGVSLKDIVEHVKQKIPELKETSISRHTIHRLLVASHIKGQESRSVVQEPCRR